MFSGLNCLYFVRKLSEMFKQKQEKSAATSDKEESGQRESNPHGQLGRLELYH
jgi:hypothetical protein